MIVLDAADLVVIDRSKGWTVEASNLLTKGFGHPLIGRSLPGEVLLTIANGRVAVAFWDGASTNNTAFVLLA